MLPTTASGFKDTPISLWLVIFTTTCPIIISLLNIQYLFDLSIQPLVQWHQYWRILLNAIVCTDQIQTIVCAMIFYEYRVLERILGSKKYGQIVLAITLICAIIVPFITGIIYKWFGKTIVFTSGPTCTISGLLAFYNYLVPVVFQVAISQVGVFSDKVFIYLVLIQLIFGSWGNTIKALIGWLVGNLLISSIKVTR